MASKPFQHTDVDVDYREANKFEHDKWETVQDKKKAKFQEKKAQLQKEQKEKEEREHKVQHATAAVKSEEPVVQEQQPKKRGNVVPQISNEVQMIEVLTSIIMSAPHHSIQISTMSQRIQELTKNNWNKKYKATYGSMPDFLKEKSDFFSFDEKTNLVTLKKPDTSKKGKTDKPVTYAQVAAPSNNSTKSSEQPKHQSKQEKASKPANKHEEKSRPKHVGTHAPKEAGSQWIMIVVALLVVLVAAAAFASPALKDVF